MVTSTIRWLLLVLYFLSCFFPALNASSGDADPLYKTCVEKCEKTGCIEDRCFQHCKFSSDGKAVDGPWYMQEPLYLRWKQWDCRSECRYYCMLNVEGEREKQGEKPVKYHGRWPLQRVFGIQEPGSVALAALNLAIQFHGWVSFFILVHYKLPLSTNKKTCYEYTGLCHLYGLLAMNSWIWSAVSHTRDVEFIEKLDLSSAVALLGFTLILAILRVFEVRDEAARIMIAAPLIAFVTTHILYLNFYSLDYGLHMKVCVAVSASTLIIWAVWAGVTRHPSRLKLWLVVAFGCLSTLLEIWDFPLYKGFVDSEVLWHATMTPISYLFWSFIKDDTELRTSYIVKKVK